MTTSRTRRRSISRLLEVRPYLQDVVYLGPMITDTNVVERLDAASLDLSWQPAVEDHFRMLAVGYSTLEGVIDVTKSGLHYAEPADHELERLNRQRHAALLQSQRRSDYKEKLNEQ